MTTKKPKRFTSTMTEAVYRALDRKAKTARRETGEYIQWVLATHAFKDEKTDEARHHRLREALIEEAVEHARNLCRTGQFSESITLRVFQDLKADSKWLGRYEDVIGDNPFKTGNEIKNSLNQEIGYRIRYGVDGTVLKEKGKSVIAKAPPGELIQSYTVFEDFDRDAVKA